MEFPMTLTPVERNVPDGSGDKYRYLRHIGDYDYMINSLLSVHWNAVLCYNPSAEQTWQAFSHILWAAVDLYVPSIMY